MRVSVDYVSSRQEASDVANAKTYEVKVGALQPEIPTFFKRYEKDIVTGFTHSSYCGISHVLILREPQPSFFFNSD